MKEIVLQNTSKGIVCHWYTNGKPDEYVLKLFGTHILPSAFTSLADPVKVTAEIKRLNPGCVVSWV